MIANKRLIQNVSVLKPKLRNVSESWHETCVKRICAEVALDTESSPKFSVPKLDPRDKQNDSGLRKSRCEMFSIGTLERDLKLTSIQDSGGSLLDMTWRIQSGECSVALKKLGYEANLKLHTNWLQDTVNDITWSWRNDSNSQQLPCKIFIFIFKVFLLTLSASTVSIAINQTYTYQMHATNIQLCYI